MGHTVMRRGFGHRIRATAIVLLTVFTACAPPSPGAPSAGATPTQAQRDTLAASYTSTDMQSLPVLFAKTTGLFDQAGVDVQLVTLAGQTGTAALVSGGIQVYEGGGSETVLADAAGSDIVTVAVTSPIYPWKIYAGPDITSTNDLKGKKLGITAKGGAYDTGLRQLLPTLNIDPDRDVTLISTGSIQNVTAALMSGAIDAAPIIVGTDSYKLEQAGFHVVYDFSAFGIIPVAGVSVRREFMNGHRPAVQKFVDGLIMSLATIKADRPAAIALMRSTFGIDDDGALNAMYDYYTGEVYAVPPTPTREQFANLANQLVLAGNDSVRQVDPASLVDASFVENAVQRGLDKKTPAT